MKQKISILLVLIFGLGMFGSTANAKKHKDQEYWGVVSQRAEKIVKTLNIKDQEKFDRIRDMIAQQYYDLNKTYDKRDASIKTIKERTKDEEKEAAKISKLRVKTEKKIAKYHDAYIENLSGELTPEQVDAVKNGMTYSVLVHTYNGYLDMLPDLTEDQKKYIMDALVEAREKAMDAGSSKEKHAWFGKYKGRINNYLSKEGYDLNKASKEWHERLKKEQEK
ncbi:DUF3826 domain-containing protein [Saccharicrinis sp. FJH2]|uniref:DUF3826 domain-containing protein n=1 Tax=Saccharicrinis sp. FJH65 TaxID=3344659 RepID=UPI0035F39E4D